MSIKIEASSLVDVFHSCESILPAPDLLDDGAVRSKPYSVDASYCIDAITSHTKYLEIEVCREIDPLYPHGYTWAAPPEVAQSTR